MKANDLRKIFLDYFAARGHKIVPSSALVPRSDPTLRGRLFDLGEGRPSPSTPPAAEGSDVGPAKPALVA